jgi:hypothetical protein
MKNRIFLCSLLLVLCSLSAFAQTRAAPASDFTFNEPATAVTITRYNGTGGNVVIPERINNKPVTAIGEEAFWEKQLTAVTIPNTVTSIGFGAFYGNQLADSWINSSGHRENMLRNYTELGAGWFSGAYTEKNHGTQNFGTPR